MIDLLPFVRLQIACLMLALACQSSAVLARPVDSQADAFPISENLQRLITDLTRTVIPHNYENEKDWGKTKDVMRGLYIKREGLRIKTHRTRRSVNHGTWTKYRVELLDPQQQFQVRLQHVRRLPNNRLSFYDSL